MYRSSCGSRTAANRQFACICSPISLVLKANRAWTQIGYGNWPKSSRTSSDTFLLVWTKSISSWSPKWLNSSYPWYTYMLNDHCLITGQADSWLYEALVKIILFSCFHSCEFKGLSLFALDAGCQITILWFVSVQKN